MSEKCAFCGKSVDPNNPGTWKEVKGWVKGKKADSMTLREDTKKYAHAACINKAKAGQAVDQPDLLTDPAPAKMTAEPSPPEDLPTDFVNDLFEKPEPTESRPTIQELIERSSLGTPAAKRLRARTSPEEAARIVARARELEQEEERGEFPF